MLLCESRSVVSDSLRPHGLYSPWNSPGQILEWAVFPSSRGSSKFILNYGTKTTLMITLFSRLTLSVSPQQVHWKWAGGPESSAAALVLSALTPGEEGRGRPRDALKLTDQATLETALDKEKTGTPVSADPAVCLWCARGGRGKVIISCVRGQPPMPGAVPAAVFRARH